LNKAARPLPPAGAGSEGEEAATETWDSDASPEEEAKAARAIVKEKVQKAAVAKKPAGGGVAAAIDMHSSSNAQLVLAEAWHMRIPLVDALKGSGEKNATISPAERVVVTQIYAVHVLSRLVTPRDSGSYSDSTAAGGTAGTAGKKEKEKERKGKGLSQRQRLNLLLKSPKAFAESLYHSRYEGLYPRSSLFMQQQMKEFKCYRIEDTGADTNARKVRENEENRQIINSVVEKLDHRLIESRDQFIADAFLDPSLDAEHAGVRLAWLQSYIERLAFWAMGGDDSSNDDSRTGLFLLQCLYQEEMLTITDEVEGDTIRLSDFTEA